MRKMLRCMVIAAGFLAAAIFCHAYPVGRSLPLDKLQKEADVVFKGTVVSSAETKDPWFTVPNYPVLSSEIRVISIIKGDAPSGKAVFLHYGRQPKDLPGMTGDRSVRVVYLGPAPQLYDLKNGRTYILFAKRTDKPDVYRQLWLNAKMKQDQGAVLAADEQPIPQGQPLKDILWRELEGLLKGSNLEDVPYAIRQLDEMSEGQGVPDGSRGLDDYDRGRVMESVRPYLFHQNAGIVKAALAAFAEDSPYANERYGAPAWLVAVGKGTIRGYSGWSKPRNNSSARAHWKDLAALGDGKGNKDLRATAVLSLGRAGEPAIFPHVVRWTQDPEPVIRKAAAILLSDFPSDETFQFLTQLAKDPAPEVRLGVARAVGFGQLEKVIPLLEALLKDEDSQVSTAAALSLVSFDTAKVERILKANMENPDFKSVFVNALAESNPDPYLDSLAEIIEKRLQPNRFWGGRIPCASSWDILFKYMQSRSADDLKSDKLSRYLDALERMQGYGSSEPRDLYALYLQRGLTDRAGKFREECRKSFTYDIEYFFKMVDKDPRGYTRQ